MFNATYATAGQAALDHSQALIDMALAEDIGSGDITALHFVKPLQVTAHMVAREAGRLSGIALAKRVFERLDPSLQCTQLMQDGSSVAPGQVVLSISGNARSIITAERTALNFAQRLSGIATLTNQYVQAVAGSKCRILDTRKTTPGYRLLEKKAVVDGGGCNHRMGLYDRVMVKDNHLLVDNDALSLRNNIAAFKQQFPHIEVQLEADNLQQLADFLQIPGVDYVLLDNMDGAMLEEAVRMRGNAARPLLEASGGITLQNIAAAARSGVDFISIGALTHSYRSLDLGLDFQA